MFQIPNFAQMHNVIVAEIRNRTGLSITNDDDASIRADGTVAVVEGLYQHQNYIQRQLFVQTADEPYLYVHAEELNLPRSGGSRATGTIKAISNVALTIEVGQKLTDGKGHFYTVTEAVELPTNVLTEVQISADQIGESWNFSGAQLRFVSPPAGLRGTADVVSVAGGADLEDLEVWRARLLARKQLGLSRDRAADLEAVMLDVSGVKHVYVYPKRRGIGSMDVAITAAGNPPALPSSQLIADAQLVLDAEAGFWADCRVYAPTVQNVDVNVRVTGVGIDLEAVRQVIRDYFAELAPAQAFVEAVLSARIMQVAGVSDVTLTPNFNIAPQVDWMHTRWLRLGTLQVST